MEWKVSVFPEKKWKQRETNVSFRWIAFVSHPPPRLHPARSLGMPLTTNQVYNNFHTCLLMDRAMEYY